MRIIITERIHEQGIQLLQRKAQVDCCFDISREELLKCIGDYDAMIVRAATKIDQEIIEAGAKLKAIGMAGIGLNHIDVAYAKNKGIAVFNVPDGSNESVAELTMALLLNLVRKVNPAVNATRYKKEWNKHGYLGSQLHGKTMGILALGKIGSRVAKFAQAFGMKVIAYDPFLDQEIARAMDVELVELDGLLVQADVVSIHAPLTKDNYHLINGDKIRKMKPGSYLINLGRGGIVDEESLYQALVQGHLAGAAVDVMEQEPPGKSKLFELDNFMATPHIGAGTVEAQKNIAMKIANTVISYLEALEAV